MKIKETVAKLEFEPITLEVTFESLEELEVFWGMTNAPSGEVEDNMRQPNDVDDCIINRITEKLFDWADRQIQKYD